MGATLELSATCAPGLAGVAPPAARGQVRRVEAERVVQAVELPDVVDLELGARAAVHAHRMGREVVTAEPLPLRAVAGGLVADAGPAGPA